MANASPNPWTERGLSRIEWLERIVGPCMTVDEWCALNRVSRTTFYKMLKQGTGPRLMDGGGRVLISPEANEEWRRRCEAKAIEVNTAETEAA